MFGLARLIANDGCEPRTYAVVPFVTVIVESLVIEVVAVVFRVPFEPAV